MHIFLCSKRLAAVLLLAAFPVTAQALTVKIVDLGDPGNPVTFTDNVAPGRVFAKDVDLVTSIASLTARSGKGSGHYQSLNFQGQMLYPRGGNLSVTVTDTDYIYRDTGRAADMFGVPASFFGTGRVQSLAGNGFSSVSWSAWLDPTNALFGMTHKIGSASQPTTGTSAVVWEERKTRVPLVDGQKFSITQEIQIDMDELNPYLAQGFDYAASIRTTVVPVPASLPMLIGALGVLGWRARRTRLTATDGTEHRQTTD